MLEPSLDLSFGYDDNVYSTRNDRDGDFISILRDDNGVPILYVWEDQDGDGVPDTAVQSDDGYPQPVDAEGNLIPLSEEGEPVSDENVIEIEFSRLNVARSPTRVLSSRYLEAITSINQADELSLDSAGRLVITVDGESRTIDSPLENLAIYVELMNTGTLDGVTLDAETLGDLAFMADGQFTVEDQKAAASFLAGAADKFGELTVDIVAYLNTNLLGLDGSIVGPNGQSYIDFSDFTYDRESAYGDISTTVLIEVSDGVWEEQTINVYDSVFNGEAYSSDSGIDGFSQAADDALQVIEYVHEFEVPAG
ncbi:MAG: hypothetical protein ACQETX_07515 [Pseudomonadota bacterium]